MILTKREREVIELVAAGEGTKAIAEKLGISRYTVKDHLKRAMQRNDWHTRAQAVASLSEHHCE
jgi:DNA-binding CsgD family transcriptional regulator